MNDRHCKPQKLCDLLSKAEVTGKDICNRVHEVYKNCDRCKQFGRPANKPIVSLPMAPNFNECVALDLHKLTELGESTWYLHVIDLFSRLSNAAIVKTKKTDVIIANFLRIWVGIYGAPSTVLTDNGGEFDSEEFRSMGETFNIRIRTTSAESPWSNGICERHNAVLTETFLNLFYDQKFDAETCLSSAIMAKNCLANHNGFSPYQLVFGSNPSLPNILDDKLPALEASTSSQTAADVLNSIHEARKEFIKLESSDRIRRALRSNIRKDEGPFFQNDEVYYKREFSDRWKGPATVIGQDGKQVFIRHGGNVVRVHPCKLRHSAHSVDNVINEVDKGENTVANNNFTLDFAPNKEVKNGENLMQSGEIMPDCEVHTEGNNTTADAAFDAEQNTDTAELDDASEVNAFVTGKPQSEIIPKPKETVEFRSSDDRWFKAKVLSRAGKATGKYKSWLNIQYIEPENLNGQTTNMDWSTEVAEWRNIENNPENENLALIVDDYADAKAKEIQKWQENNVYQRVEPRGQSTISTRWVLTQKGENRKARLVARGFQDAHAPGKTLSDSPTCGKETLRLMISVTQSFNWGINSIDVKTAFLQSSIMERDVYLVPPVESGDTNYYWKLNKCVYGLEEASRSWYLTVKETLLGFGMVVSDFDNCLFLYKPNNTLAGYLTCHVDDFFWAGTAEFERAVILPLKGRFSIGSEERDNFKYLGVQIFSKEKRICLGLSEFIRSLEETDVSEVIDEKAVSQYRTSLGKLQWIASQIRPDISFLVSQLANAVMSLTNQDFALLNKLVRKLKYEQNYELPYHSLDLTTAEIIVYTDASLANCEDGGTQGGVLVCLKDQRNSNVAALVWHSRRLKRVVHSTLAAEALAMVDGLDNAIALKHMIFEVTGYNLPISAFTDSKSLLDSVNSLKNVKEKRLRVEICYIREAVGNESVKLLYCTSNTQLADCLTKSTKCGMENLRRFLKIG